MLLLQWNLTAQWMDISVHSAEKVKRHICLPMPFETFKTSFSNFVQFFSKLDKTMHGNSTVKFAYTIFVHSYFMKKKSLSKSEQFVMLYYDKNIYLNLNIMFFWISKKCALNLFIKTYFIAPSQTDI